jgi:hypothetical protein
MAKFGLVGPSYQSQSVNADCQKTANLYVEKDESGAGKSPFQLYPTPGLSLFSVCGTGPIRAEINANQRCFVVSGDTLYEVFTDGTNTAIGAIGDDGNPASMCNSATQLAVVSNGTLYVCDLGSTTLTTVATGLGPVKMVAYSDGYFICLISDSQKFQISSLLDATTWDPTDVTQVSVFPDKVLSLIVDHREIFLMGVTKSVFYGNTGAADFPYSPIPSSYIEQGVAAAWCRDKLDNSVFWLGADDRGQLIAWRAQGYTPARISNTSVERAWQSYSRTDDAISYAHQLDGHIFWRITFLTAQKTWEYDCLTQMWNEVFFLNNGVEEAHLSRCHTFVFGLHLVGDRRNGNVYVMSINLPDDDGFPIKRVRRAPHISDEQKWIYGSQFQLDAECGLPTVSSNPLGGLVYQRVAITPGTNVPLGDLGPLNILVTVVLRDGTTMLAPVHEGANDQDHVTNILLPAVTDAITWRINYCPLGLEDGISYQLNYPSYSGGLPLDHVTLPHELGTVAPSLVWLQGNRSTDVNRNPVVFLNKSDDGGHTFENIAQMNLGEPGDYKYRCIARRLGRWRDRVWEIEYSDTAPFRIVDAYLNNQ